MAKENNLKEEERKKATIKAIDKALQSATYYIYLAKKK